MYCDVCMTGKDKCNSYLYSNICAECFAILYALDENLIEPIEWLEVNKKRYNDICKRLIDSYYENDLEDLKTQIREVARWKKYSKKAENRINNNMNLYRVMVSSSDLLLAIKEKEQEFFSTKEIQEYYNFTSQLYRKIKSSQFLLEEGHISKTGKGWQFSATAIEYMIQLQYYQKQQKNISFDANYCSLYESKNQLELFLRINKGNI